MDENAQSGFTLREICKIILSQKWLALLIAVIITLAGTIFLYFGYAKPREEYKISFICNVTDNENMLSIVAYPDGNHFHPSDYFSLETLTAVRDGDENFADININGIAENMGMTDVLSSMGRDTIVENSGLPIIHTIELSINASYFDNEKQAQNFLRALANYPSTKYAEIGANSNQVYLDSEDFNNALNFSTQLDYIQTQIDNINQGYAALPDISDRNGVPLRVHQQRFAMWAEHLDLKSLREEASSNLYLKDHERSVGVYLNELIILRNNLADSYKNLNSTIDSLKELGSIQTDAARTIARYQEEITKTERQIINYNRYISAYYEVVQPVGEPDYTQPVEFVLDGEGNKIEKTEHIEATQKYSNKLQEIYREFVSGEEVNTYTSVSRDIYRKNSDNLILAPNFTFSNSLNLVVCIIGSLILGIIVALIAAYFVGKRYYLQRAVTQPQAEQPEVGMAQPQVEDEKQNSEEE